ncbi:hypothetical protein DPMN_119188, partial [Dreissena polymorpha]
CVDAPENPSLNADEDLPNPEDGVKMTTRHNSLVLPWEPAQKATVAAPANAGNSVPMKFLQPL